MDFLIQFNLYICRTCQTKSRKGQVPCQADTNKSEVFDLLLDFQSTKKLEKVLIAKGLP